MPQSMTAFARSSDQNDQGIATWEIRIVNHRYFDCSIKLPEAFRKLEANIRSRLQKTLERGRIECFLRFKSFSKGGADFVLNEDLIKKLVTAVREIKGYLPMSTIDPMKILTWPQVMQAAEEDLGESQEMILNIFEKSLVELIETREREGKALAKLISDRIKGILEIVAKVKTKMPQVLSEQREKIIKRLEEVAENLDQSRLEQEMVYFSQKVDVSEEVDRLETHAEEVIRLLNEEGSIGKKLDFLMQELNREANTLASKSADIEITQAALELKVLIEQMREQVQNIV